jgi:ubiquinol-cytochrome c reductase cytochrome c1 subunit
VRWCVFVLLLLPSFVLAFAPRMSLDKAPDWAHDPLAVQCGAALFEAHCLACHSAKGLVSPMSLVDARAALGAVPPDLSQIARARGGDYIYTYLRAYYLDSSQATGWNNAVFPNVNMPHVLADLQGAQLPQFENRPELYDKTRDNRQIAGFVLSKPGKMSQVEYDRVAAELTGFLVYVGEPSRQERLRLGVFVVLFFSVFTVFAWRLHAAYWKDVK